MRCVMASWQSKLFDIRIVPELEILTTFLDFTLNFVSLIGLPQWNGHFLAGELARPPTRSLQKKNLAEKFYKI